MFNKRKQIDNLYNQIIRLTSQIDSLSKDSKKLQVTTLCKECGVYFKTGTGKDIPWTNLAKWFYGPSEGTFSYCTWCQPDYDRTEFSMITGEKEGSWKYFKCEEVDLET